MAASILREVSRHFFASAAARGRGHVSATALPHFHRDGGGQSHRRKRYRPAQNDLAWNGGSAGFRPSFSARAGISALVRRSSARYRDSRLPEPTVAVAPDDLLYEPAHRRYSAATRWRAASATIRGPTRHRRASRLNATRRRDLPDGYLQPIAHVCLPRHDSALWRVDVFFAEGASAALRRSRGKSGKVQFTPDRRDQRHRSGQGS